jgi:hypothetical protein
MYLSNSTMTQVLNRTLLHNRYNALTETTVYWPGHDRPASRACARQLEQLLDGAYAGWETCELPDFVFDVEAGWRPLERG